MDKNDKIEDEFDVKTDLSNKNSVDGLGYTESANNTNVGGRRCGKKMIIAAILIVTLVGTLVGVSLIITRNGNKNYEPNTPRYPSPSPTMRGPTPTPTTEIPTTPPTESTTKSPTTTPTEQPSISEQPTHHGETQSPTTPSPTYLSVTMTIEELSI